jgi:hypothetical protein
MSQDEPEVNGLDGSGAWPSVDGRAADGAAAPAGWVDPDTGSHTERLGRRLAELYNENTLLRARLRRLEDEMRAADDGHGRSINRRRD